MLRVGGSPLSGCATGERALSGASTDDLDRQLERSLERLSVSLQRIERLLSELQGERRAQYRGSDERDRSQGAPAEASAPARAVTAPEAEPRAPEAQTPAGGVKSGAGAEARAAAARTHTAGAETRAARAEIPEMWPQIPAVELAAGTAESQASAPETLVRVIHGSGRSAFPSSTRSG